MVRAAAVEVSRSPLRGGGFCHDSARALANEWQSRDTKGLKFVSRTAGYYYDRLAADCGCISRLRTLSNGRTGRRLVRHLQIRGRTRRPALADRAVEGRALAHRLRRGDADRGRAFADRTRWTRCRSIARAARRTAVFLARRDRVAGCGDLARDARDRARAGRVQHDHPRNSRARRPTAAAECDAG